MNPPITASPGAANTASSAKDLLSTLGGFAGPVGSIIGGLLGSSSAKERNKMQMELAREQMRFQERMSNTAYQRAAADLEKAGLNRILALGKPASSPAGAMAQLETPAKSAVAGINSALAIRRQQQEIKNMQAQERLTNQQAVVQRASANQIQSQDALAQASTNETIQRMMNIVAARPGVTAQSKIAQLRIPGVQTEEQFYKWINSADAAEEFKALGAGAPIVLNMLRLLVQINRK